MKTKSIVAVIVLVILSVMGLVAWNAFSVKREFVVLYNTQHEFCFLLDDGYKYSIQKDGLTYSGGKNSGEIKLLKGELSPGFNKVGINGFVSGDKKLKKLRVYDFILGNGYKLVDHCI